MNVKVIENQKKEVFFILNCIEEIFYTFRNFKRLSEKLIENLITKQNDEKYINFVSLAARERLRMLEYLIEYLEKLKTYDSLLSEKDLFEIEIIIKKINDFVVDYEERGLIQKILLSENIALTAEEQLKDFLKELKSSLKLNENKIRK